MNKQKPSSTLGELERGALRREAGTILEQFVRPELLVGTAHSLTDGLVPIHLLRSLPSRSDALPRNSVLVATRFERGSETDFDHKDATFVLLNVERMENLSMGVDAGCPCVEAEQIVETDEERQPETGTRFSPPRAGQLAVSMLRCRVLGGFQLVRSSGSTGPLELGHGGEVLAEFNPRKPFYVYKPTSHGLKLIAHCWATRLGEKLFVELAGL